MASAHRVLRSEIGHLADIIIDIEEFEAAIGVVKDELPRSLTYRTEGVLSIVVMRKMPDEAPVRDGWAGTGEKWFEADAIDGLEGAAAPTGAGKVENCGEEIFDDDGGLAKRAGASEAWPAGNHRNADASLVGRELLTTQRQVARAIMRGAIVGGEDDDGIAGDAKVVESRDQVTKRFVHAFEHRRAECLERLEAGGEVFGVKPLVLLPRGVDGIVGKVEIEGASGGGSLLDDADGLAGEGLGEVDLLAVIGFKAGDIPDMFRRFGAPGRTEVSFAVVAAGSAGGVSTDVDIKAKVAGIFAGRTFGAEMSLADVDCLVAGRFEQLRERRYADGAIDAGKSGGSVEIPSWRIECRMGIIRGGIASQRPVGDSVSGGIHPAEDADSRR